MAGLRKGSLWLSVALGEGWAAGGVLAALLAALAAGLGLCREAGHAEAPFISLFFLFWFHAVAVAGGAAVAAAVLDSPQAASLVPLVAQGAGSALYFALKVWKLEKEKASVVIASRETALSSLALPARYSCSYPYAYCRRRRRRRRRRRCCRC